MRLTQGLKNNFKSVHSASRTNRLNSSSLSRKNKSKKYQLSKKTINQLFLHWINLKEKTKMRVKVHRLLIEFLVSATTEALSKTNLMIRHLQRDRKLLKAREGQNWCIWVTIVILIKLKTLRTKPRRMHTLATTTQAVRSIPSLNLRCRMIMTKTLEMVESSIKVKTSSNRE